MGFFSDMASSLLAPLDSWAHTMSTNATSAIVPVITTAATLMIFFHGLSVIRGDSSQPFMSLFWKVFKIGAIICALDLYSSSPLDIYDSVVNIQTELQNLLTGGTDAFGAIDSAIGPIIGLFGGLLAFFASLFTEGKADTIVTAVIMVCFVGMGGGALGIAFFFALLSKLGLYVLLGLGPLFIAGLAFGPTVRFFDMWLSSLLSFSVTGAVAVIVLQFVVSMQSYLLLHLFVNPLSTLILGALCGFVSILFMMEVPRLVSQLTHGADMTGGFTQLVNMRGVYNAPWLPGKTLGSGGGAAARYAASAGGSASAGTTR